MKLLFFYGILILMLIFSIFCSDGDQPQLSAKDASEPV